MYSEQQLKEFEQWGVTPPISAQHDTNLRRMAPRNWRQEGNRLIAETDMGELTQFIPTDVMLEGIDANGLPKLRKIVL